MSSWGPVTFTIGSSSTSSFPMAQFKDVNSPTTIKWTATSSQIGARTLRIRTTEAFAGGRPQITVNSWTSSAPAGQYLASNILIEMETLKGTLRLIKHRPLSTPVASLVVPGVVSIKCTTSPSRVAPLSLVQTQFRSMSFQGAVGMIS